MVGVGLTLADGGFEFGDAGGDLPPGGGGDVVGFEVEYLALQPAVEFGDLRGRFAEAGGDGRAAVVFLVGGCGQCLAPVRGAVGAEDGARQPARDGLV
ncbi:MAG: hypothetical protein E6F99_24105 [Actinobacteria bacterium]|nr:MAG: hypothetical protein E6F99_24105 [Actinomycetota bacterium]